MGAMGCAACWIGAACTANAAGCATGYAAAAGIVCATGAADMGTTARGGTGCIFRGCQLLGCQLNGCWVDCVNAAAPANLFTPPAAAGAKPDWIRRPPIRASIGAGAGAAWSIDPVVNGSALTLPWVKAHWL
ncbi:MAG: hypothetical protein LBS11_07615 [Oscillospiraceae bacterium]|jgi:hypothetical protein|nr:hypothetical protein [Oscillospiraceae bacterium]